MLKYFLILKNFRRSISQEFESYYVYIYIHILKYITRQESREIISDSCKNFMKILY